MATSFQTSQEFYTPYPASFGIPLVATSCFSACLSIAGSSCILCMARRDFFRQTLQRILFCISLSDIGLSITLLLMPFVVPQELDLNYAAFGNQQTCYTATFFMGVFVFTSTFYNFYLCFYFLKTVKSQWREPRSIPKWEIGLHFLTLAIPLFCSSVLVANSADGTIGPHASMLICGPDLKSYHSNLMKVTSYFYAGLVVLTNLASFVALFLLYCTVRKKMTQSSQFRFQARRGSAASAATTGSKSKEQQVGDDHQDKTQDPSNAETQLESSSNHTWISRISNASRSSWAGSSRLSGSSRTSQTERDPFQQRILQVRNQSICYSLIYFNSIIFWFVLQGYFAGNWTPKEVQEKKTTPGLYTVHLLAAFFIPLAGACNFLVYTRPKVQRWKKMEPDRSRFWIWRELIKGTEIPTSSGAARRRRQQRQEAKKKKNQVEEEEEASPTATLTATTSVWSCCYSGSHDVSAAATKSMMMVDEGVPSPTQQETTHEPVHPIDSSQTQGATASTPANCESPEAETSIGMEPVTSEQTQSCSFVDNPSREEAAAAADSTVATGQA